MGTQKSEAQLFSYAVNLAKRVASQSSSAPGKTVIVAYDLVTPQRVLRPITSFARQQRKEFVANLRHFRR
jgi:hypothetical protein